MPYAYEIRHSDGKPEPKTAGTAPPDFCGPYVCSCYLTYSAQIWQENEWVKCTVTQKGGLQEVWVFHHQ